MRPLRAPLLAWLGVAAVAATCTGIRAQGMPYALPRPPLSPPPDALLRAPIATLTDMGEVGPAFVASQFSALEKFYASLLESRARDENGDLLSEVFVSRLRSAVSPTISPDFKGRRYDPAVRANGWFRTSPDSMIARIARSEVLLTSAEKADADGDWKLANEQFDAAHALLNERRTAVGRDVNWHTQMMRIGRRQGWSAYRVVELFKAAIAVDKDATGPYLAAAGAVPPRFPDSPAILEWIARRAVENTRAREGQAMYARVYTRAVQAHQWTLTDPLAAGTVQWSTLNQSFRDQFSRHPRDTSLDAWAAFACAAGDRTTASTVFGRMKEQAPDATVWNAWPGDSHARCKAWATSGKAPA